MADGCTFLHSDPQGRAKDWVGWEGGLPKDNRQIMEGPLEIAVRPCRGSPSGARFVSLLGYSVEQESV